MSMTKQHMMELALLNVSQAVNRHLDRIFDHTNRLYQCMCVLNETTGMFTIDILLYTHDENDGHKFEPIEMPLLLMQELSHMNGSQFYETIKPCKGGMSMDYSPFFGYDSDLENHPDPDQLGRVIFLLNFKVKNL